MVAPSSVDDIAAALHSIPLFALLDDRERHLLAQQMELETYAEGATVFSRGDPGDRLYAVQRGRVEISVVNNVGDKIVLEVARPGDFFGEISLLDGGSRTASATALEDLEVVIVDREDLKQLFVMSPDAGLDLLTAIGGRLRETTRLLRSTASRDINIEQEEKVGWVMRAADWISAFSGSLAFLFIHLGLFFVWIALNVAPLSHSRIGGFDPFPFGLLTMAVSLEAIILSVFVLLSQNRQVDRERVRNDIEYRVNLKAELEIAQLHKKFDDFEDRILSKIEALSKTR